MSFTRTSSTLSTEQKNCFKDFSFVPLAGDDMEANDRVTSVLIWQAENYRTHYSLNQPYCALNDAKERSSSRNNECDIQEEWFHVLEKEQFSTKVKPMCSVKVFTVGSIVPSSQNFKNPEEKKTKGTKLQLLGLSCPEELDSFYHNMLYLNVENFFKYGLNSALIDLVSTQHCEPTSSFVLYSKMLKKILLQMVSYMQNTLKLSTATRNKGKLTFLSPSLQRQWISTNTHLLYKNILFSEPVHQETEYPVLRRLFACCILMPLDETTQHIIDALSESGNELEISFSNASDLLDLRNVTFFNLLDEDAVDHYLETIEKRRKTLPSDISYAVLCSVYCDTCRDYFPVPKSQLSKFSFLQVQCQGVISRQTVVLDSLLALLQQPRYSIKGFLRPTHLFSCILEDLLGGISKTIVVSSVFSGCPEKLIEIATSFAKITLSPSVMPTSTTGAMAQCLLNWEEFLSFVIQNSSSPCVNKIVDAAIGQISGSQLTREQLIHCLKGSSSFEVTVLQCRKLLLGSCRVTSSTQRVGQPSTTNMKACFSRNNCIVPNGSFHLKKGNPLQFPAEKRFHIVSTLRIMKNPSRNLIEMSSDELLSSQDAILNSCIKKPITPLLRDEVKSFSKKTTTPPSFNRRESTFPNAATPWLHHTSIPLPMNETTTSLVDEETVESRNEEASSLAIQTNSPTLFAITPPKLAREKRVWSRPFFSTLYADKSNKGGDVIESCFCDSKGNAVNPLKCNPINKEKPSSFCATQDSLSLSKKTTDKKSFSEAFITLLQ
ncbi:uncharacterized protein LOC128883396 isoform X2 [Hylaeus volcanicus]|uniref:uncharacterized protein LOC128883396 isoform X2 n=1 Tax=Hylaeus volcanicus TaxID=313075 RepID=UPI0023B793C0|nr:uncharacterized protein LOC128883396 isoform X2 [Hylaeus volcanicus]